MHHHAHDSTGTEGSGCQGHCANPTAYPDGAPELPEVLTFEQPTDAVREFFGLSFGQMEAFAHMLEEEGELRGLIVHVSCRACGRAIW